MLGGRVGDIGDCPRTSPQPSYDFASASSMGILFKLGRKLT